MIRNICLTIALALVAPVVCATTVGETHRFTTTPTAALRDAAHSDKLAITIWYPAVDGAKEQPLVSGPPGAPFFISGSAAAEAAPAAGRYPVVLFSHGFGGSAHMMGWFGTALARAGFVVIGVDHPGNNGNGAMTRAGAVLWWERADDLKAAWAAVRADAVIGAHIDASRLGVSGFSAGGFTSLVAAGARTDIPHYIAFCNAHPTDGVCKPQKEAPEITGLSPEKIYNDPVLKAQLPHATDDHSIPGIKGVYVMAPALIQAIAPSSFADIHVPVSMILGTADAIAEPPTNGDVAAKAMAGSRITRLPGVGHYDFLGNCTDAGRTKIPLCQDVPPQEPTHARAVADATAFFKATL